MCVCVCVCVWLGSTIPSNINGYVQFLKNMFDTILRGVKMLIRTPENDAGKSIFISRILTPAHFEP